MAETTPRTGCSMLRMLDNQAGAATIGVAGVVLGVVLASVFEAQSREAEHRHVENLEATRRAQEVFDLERQTVADVVADLHRVANTSVVYTTHAIAAMRAKAAEQKGLTADERDYYHRELEWARDQYWPTKQRLLEEHAVLRGRLSVARALLVIPGIVSTEAWQPCARAWEQPLVVDTAKLLADAETQERLRLQDWLTAQLAAFNDAGRNALAATFIECARVLDGALGAIAMQRRASAR